MTSLTSLKFHRVSQENIKGIDRFSSVFVDVDSMLTCLFVPPTIGYDNYELTPGDLTLWQQADTEWLGPLARSCMLPLSFPYQDFQILSRDQNRPISSTVIQASGPCHVMDHQVRHDFPRDYHWPRA